MIIGRDLAVKIGILDDFKCQILQWDGVELLMKEPSIMLGQTYSTNCEMREVVMQIAEPVSKREATERLEKITNITYANAELESAASNKQKTQLISIPKYFEDLFNVTLGYWDTEPVNLELNPNSKPFNCKYYPVPRTNKDNFHKDLH